MHTLHILFEGILVVMFVVAGGSGGVRRQHLPPGEDRLEAGEERHVDDE